MAAVSVLIALVGLGFGLLQAINRPDTSQASMAFAPTEQNAAIIGTTVAVAGVQSGAGLSDPAAPLAVPPRAIKADAKVIEPNYTVVSGDTLGVIAVRFNTTVARIQALNNLSDPRALRVGTRLVIPPPL